MIDWQILTEYAKKVSSQDHSGHGFDHIERVVANAKQLVAKTAGVDATVVVAAATMHDTYDDKLVADVRRSKSSRPASDGRGRVDAGADSGSDRNY